MDVKKIVLAYAANIGQQEDWHAVIAKGMATGAENEVYNQGDASGFIGLTGLRLKIQALQGI